MSGRIRIGIVGAGYIADYHARGIQACQEAEVTAVADRDTIKSADFAKRYSVPRQYGSFNDMLSSGEIDAVILSVPNAFHYPYTMEALRAGKHVFVEKPMACSAVEAEEMDLAARQADIVLMVGHVWRFDREVRYLREQVSSEGIGRVFRTTSYGIHSNWGPGGWFTDPDLAWGGALADMGVHAIDTTRFLIGDPKPILVYASVQSNMERTLLEDTAVVMIEWSNGVSSIVESGWWQPHMDGPEAGTKLYGTRGFGSVFPTRIKIRQGEEDIVNAPEFPKREEHCDQHMYTLQMGEFAAAIRERRPAVPGSAEGIINMRILEAAYESSRTGTAIRLNEN